MDEVPLSLEALDGRGPSVDEVPLSLEALDSACPTTLELLACLANAARGTVDVCVHIPGVHVARHYDLVHPPADAALADAEDADASSFNWAYPTRTLIAADGSASTLSRIRTEHGYVDHVFHAVPPSSADLIQPEPLRFKGELLAIPSAQLRPLVGGLGSVRIFALRSLAWGYQPSGAAPRWRELFYLKTPLKVDRARLLVARVIPPAGTGGGNGESLRADQAEKELVQARARELFASAAPGVPRRKDLIATLREEGFTAYEDSTLNRWIAEVDPRPPEQRGGRPRKRDRNRGEDE